MVTQIRRVNIVGIEDLFRRLANKARRDAGLVRGAEKREFLVEARIWEKAITILREGEVK